MATARVFFAFNLFWDFSKKHVILLTEFFGSPETASFDQKNTFFFKNPEKSAKNVKSSNEDIYRESDVFCMHNA